MIVAINHSITDPKKWEEAGGKIFPMIQEGKLPQGIKALCYLPASDGRKANCVWEANSVEELKRFLEPLTSPAARNEYFQVNADQAMGLPVGEHAAVH
jgi:hypothetical protein